MRPRVERQEAAGVHFGITLGGGQAGVTQQLLDGTEIGPGAEQMGGEAVAQGMRLSLIHI